MDKNEDFYKRCIGCNSYNKMIKKPNCSMRRIPYIPEGSICPCQTCIVKIMCNNSCHDFRQFINKLKDKERELFIGQRKFYSKEE